jgi:hypothetical protein
LLNESRHHRHHHHHQQQQQQQLTREAVTDELTISSLIAAEYEIK